MGLVMVFTLKRGAVMKRAIFLSFAIFTFITHLYSANISIDVTQERASISPHIYGVNIYGPLTAAYLNDNINWASRRLGGNRATGYNWENNASNAGADYGPNQSDNWFCTVYGTTDCGSPGAQVRKFVNDSVSRSWSSLVTAQMAGFVAADGLGTNVTAAGTAGNTTDRWKTVVFKKPGGPGTFQLNPDTTDEYVYMDEFVNWMVNQFGGSGAANGIKMISLDNEPTLWTSTHPMIHPVKATYAEMKQKTIDLATAIKDVDPGILTFGSVEFGWSGFMNLNSAVDAATEGAGYSWFIDYYLDKLEEASTAYGRRLLDVLDIHWYPEDNGNLCRIVYTDYDADCPDKTNYALNSDARMQAPRCLWDSTYTEDSWIPSPIRLIPRLQTSIDTYYPGTKIAITEYDFGGGTHYSAGIAEADALGVFGKYGVFAAYLWDITPGEYTLAGVRLFRNYDGAKSTYGDTKVKADTSDITNMTVYASQFAADASKLHIIILNKSGSTQAANISIAGPYTFDSGRVWAFDSAAYNITERTNIPSITGNTFTYNVPAYTAMHMVLTSSLMTPTRTPTINLSNTRTPTPTVSPTSTPPPSSIMLDDCEDGNTQNNLSGAWYNYKDAASTINPDPFVMTAGGMAGSAAYMASMTGTISAGGYGGTGTNLNAAGTEVDMTGYVGAEFYVKGSGNYWFQFTQPVITGSHFGKSFTATSTWTKVTVMFATDLTQRYGGPDTFTQNALIALQWATNSEGAQDLQIDNVRLLLPASSSPTNTPTAALTATRTNSLTYTPTSTRTLTNTPPSTSTYTRSQTFTATVTPTFTNTQPATSTNTPAWTATATVTLTSTTALTMTFTNTNTPTTAYTSTNTPPYTATITPTAADSFTASPVISATFTPVTTLSSTASHTPSLTVTATFTGSITASSTSTNTLIDTPVNTATNTPFVSPTHTPTLTITIALTAAAELLFSTDRSGDMELFRRSLAGVETNITNNGAGDFNPNISHSGEYAVFSSYRTGTYQIYRLRLSDNTVVQLTNNTATEWDPAYNTNDSSIAFKSTRDDGLGDIFAMNADGAAQTNLTPANNTTEEWDPDFTRDSSQIVFVSRLIPGDPNSDEIFIMNADGSNVRRLTNNLIPDWYPSCSPVDDKILFISKEGPGLNDNIYTMNYDSSGRVLLSSLPGDNDDPYFSPDGTQIVFINNNTGNYDIYIMNADGTNPTVLAVNSSTELCPVYLRTSPTPTPTQTITATHTPSNTFTFTATTTLTSSPSYTTTPSHTQTSTVTIFTPTVTRTATLTVTAINTATLTRTPANTATTQPTLTNTPENTATTESSGTLTPTQTNLIPTLTVTPTITPTTQANDGIVYPNPVNPGIEDVKLGITLNRPADVITFRLYSPGYRLIREIIWTSVPAGYYTGTVGKSQLVDLSNGVYYCRISITYQDKTTEKMKIRKLVIIR